MSRAVQDRGVHTRTSEEAALNRLIERLTQRFPELSREEIIRAVHGRYADFDDSPVRDFVPVLVERAARGDLGTPRHRA